MMSAAHRRSLRRAGVWRSTGLALLVGSFVGCVATPALAATGAPSWAVKSVALPTNFTTEDSTSCNEEFGHFERFGCDAYVVTATNVGTEPSNGPILIKDTLPAGVAVVQVPTATAEPGGEPLNCTEERGASSVECEYSGARPPVPPGGVLTFSIEVTTSLTEGSVTNRAEVAGGGAAAAGTALPSTVANTIDSAAPVGFGIQGFSASVLAPDGAGDMQAGDHPATIATTFHYTTVLDREKRAASTSAEFHVTQEPRTDIVDLPVGFVGDSLAARQCPESALIRIERDPELCPDSQVGEVQLEAGLQPREVRPIYDVTPEAGYPAEFGFELDEAIILMAVRLLPSPQGYVLSVAVPDVPRSSLLGIDGLTVSFFGDPTERDRGGNGEALLTNPSACSTGPLSARIEADSWVDPGHWASAETPMYEAGFTRSVTGCNLLQFEPSITVLPEETQADTPSGYEVDLKVPQARDVPGILATPNLRDAVVVLPEGVAISPSAADGLVACKETGPQGINITHGWTPTGEQPLDPADPEATEIAPDGLPHVAPGHCPQASQIGTVEVVTPLLARPLQGHVYLAEPQCGEAGQPVCTQASATNGELYALYLEAAGSGVIIKLKGTVSASPVTGQLTTSFKENPQMPFTELKLRLEGGVRAPLANPQGCGTFTTTSDLTPWSAPATPDATPSSSFSIGGCASPMPFAPSFVAGTLTAAAAGSSPFTLTLARRDGEQDLLAISTTLPAGLVGLLSQVPLCGEPLAAAGQCPEASKIGTTTVAAGAGAQPFFVSGDVYLTGPYDGAPFGLSAVVPAKAGPFNLGDVVVRAAIDVNPLTAAVTVTSSAFPQILDGVPLRVQTVNVLVNRPGFILNPTSCERQSVTGEIAASQGAVAGVSSPFAVEGCKSLAFNPSFTASTQGKASKQDGASLDVKVTYPAGAQANIRAVKTDLPLQLPSRLSTLQRACTAAVFESNPGKCPDESVVGIARASTPVLPGTLVGPAYIVSHGGERLPNLVIVLQDDGVRVDLVGETAIKHGITSTTFRSIPDDPVSSFEVYLPEGRYSILGAFLPAASGYDLCGHKLSMPTEITAQNGAVIKQSTPIAVTGCSTVRPAGRAKRQKTSRRPTTVVRANRGGAL